MGRIEKTVFISYRRSNFYTALAVYQHLKPRGYDTSLDLKNTSEKHYRKNIFDNIRARTHFLVILSPSSLEEKGENWLRRTIEIAIEEKRHIVPLFLEGFEHNSQSIRKSLTGKLSLLKRLNGVKLSTDNFSEKIEKLCDQHLNLEKDNILLHPLSDSAKKRITQQEKIFSKMRLVKKKELLAEKLFEEGYSFAMNKKFAEAIPSFSKALHIQPKFSAAYYKRGLAREKEGDLEGALADFDQTLRFQPNFPQAHMARGIAFSRQGDFKKAIKDFSQALQMQSDLAEAYYHRGNARGARGDIPGAIRDYDEALRIKPGYAAAYNHRGIEYYNQGNFKEAISNFNQALRIEPNFADAYINRGLTHSTWGNISDAIANFMQAIHLDPDIEASYYHLAKALERNEENKAALSNYQKYLYFSKGVQYGNQESAKEAIQQLRKKIK
jgi:tetratricopeptide (TPR) repeat protein